MRASWFLLPLLLGCGRSSEVDSGVLPACEQGGTTEILLLRNIVFPREFDGVTTGFDVDDVVTSSGDSTGCGVADQVSPDGMPGIDNSFARLRPALDQTEASALDDIVLEAIHAGGLLAMVEVSGIGEDPLNDDCVDVTVTSAVGLPMVGNDGWILPGQTFERDPAAPVSTVTGARIVDGVLEDGPVDLSLPFQFLDADVEFFLQNGKIRLDFNQPGLVTGLIGGGIRTQELSDLAKNTGIDETVEVLLDSVLGLNADLGPDETGTCEQISVTLEVEAVQAFWYEGA